MVLANPIWLFALAAVGIPIVIHLWNIKPGKTLKVGSIALFTASSPTSSRSFKLSDILLLLTRCLLLALLTLLLTAPLRKDQLNSKKAKGWLLISRADFKEAYQKYQHLIDSLNQAGYEFHLFESGFSKQDINEFKNTAPADSSKLNYWSLIKQLENHVSAETSIALFTSNNITHFTGEKPTSKLKLNWQTYTPAESVSTWPTAAWLKANGNIRVLQGTSTPSATNYQYQDIRNGQSDTYSITIDKGLPYISYRDTKIAVDTAATRIAIYADKRSIDVGYLTAALKAIGQLSKRKSAVRFYNNAADIPSNQSWIYWLSAKPVPQAVIAKTKNLLVYESGKIAEVNTTINNIQSHTLAQGSHKISLYKSIAAKAKGNAVWTNGYGNPILTAEQTGNTNTYHFYSRFNPAWTDLIWNDEFPAWLMELTQPAIENIGLHERRSLSNEQVQPVFSDTLKEQNQAVSYTDLSPYLWLALMLIFIIERWLATKNQSTLKHG